MGGATSSCFGFPGGGGGGGSSSSSSIFSGAPAVGALPSCPRVPMFAEESPAIVALGTPDPLESLGGGLAIGATAAGGNWPCFSAALGGPAFCAFANPVAHTTAQANPVTAAFFTSRPSPYTRVESRFAPSKQAMGSAVACLASILGNRGAPLYRRPSCEGIRRGTGKTVGLVLRACRVMLGGSHWRPEPGQHVDLA